MAFGWFRLIRSPGHIAARANCCRSSTFIGVGGIFLFAFMRLLGKQPMIPVKDPRLPESLAFENF